MKKSKFVVLAIAAIVCAGGAIAKKVNRAATTVAYYTQGGACTVANILKTCSTSSTKNLCVTDFGWGPIQLYKRVAAPRACATVLRTGI